MATLLDAINSNTNSALKPQGVQDNTAKLSQMLRAKSGKAGAAPATAQSNLQEQQAVVQTNQQIQQQVAPAAAIQQEAQAQDMAGVQQAGNIQQQEVQQARRENEVRTRLQTNEMLSNFENNKSELAGRRNISQIEQLGQNIRLENKKYVDDLQRKGQEARLNDDQGFREALTQSELSNAQIILGTKLKNNSILSATDRDYSRVLAQMGIDDAYKMFRDDQKAARESALYTGIGALATAGIGAAATAADKKASKLDKDGFVKPTDAAEPAT